MADSADALPWLTRLADGNWRVAVRVQPGAKKNEISGVMDGRLRIRLMAQAVENKANKALVAFVAQKLGLRPSRVRLASGETGREKILIVSSEREPDWAALCRPE